MKFDVSKLEWTRKPKDYSISADKLKLLQSDIQIYGREHIIISEMTMHLYCK